MRTNTIDYDNIEFDIEYEFTPSEPAVYNYGDGSGYSGCGAEVEILSIKISDYEVYDIIYQSVISKLEELIIEAEEE
jgi:hypothetical protein